MERELFVTDCDRLYRHSRAVPMRFGLQVVVLFSAFRFAALTAFCMAVAFERAIAAELSATPARP